jgi:pectate lyase
VNTKTRSITAATTLLCLVASASAGAADVNIRGVVYDAGTNAVLPGVKAELKSAALTATSDAKGFYKISSTSGIRAEGVSDIGARIRLVGTRLSFTAPEGPVVHVRIVATNLQGRSEVLHQGEVAPGTYSIPLSETLRSSGLYLLETRVGSLSTTHKVVVESGRMFLQGAVSSITPSIAARSAATPWDTLILSKSGYTTVKIALATSTDSVPRTNMSVNTQVPDIGSLNAGVVGYATVGGSTTGGGNAAATTVKTLAEFKAAVSDKNPRVIIVEGTITATNAVQIASNKTIIGKDKTAKIYGGIEMNGVNNVIVRNLNIQGVWPNSGAGDAVAVKGQAHHIWLDHLAIWDSPDGQMDITQAANYVTVSWCKFWYTNASHPHRLNGLISAGGGTQPDDWGKLKVTYHHNWFADLVDQRMPRVMYGEVHVYNNYYTSKGNGYCIGIGSYGSVLVENNYFKGVNNPISFMYDLYAWITQRGNTYDGTSGTGPKLEGKQGSRYETNQPFECKALATVPYAYPVTPAADIPTLVSKYAGPQ